VDRGAVWFSQPTNGSITRVDAATHQVTAVVEIGEPSGSGFPLFREPYTLAAGPGGLWAALPEDGVVVRLDERTGEVTARISLGEPVALAPMAGAVWVLDRQFTQLVRIDTETCDRLPFIGPRADLRGCDLAGAVLIGVDLSGADLRWATIGLSPMQQADLTDADLRGSDLQHATLDGATWSSTICPDGSLSDDNGGSCLGHLRP
jgi:streptogramin lyase